MLHAPVVAVHAEVVVLALGAAVARAGLNLPLAVVAGARKGGGLRIVQVVQHHHAAVLGPPQGVELVVVALAQRQERLQGTQVDAAASTLMPAVQALFSTEYLQESMSCGLSLRLVSSPEYFRSAEAPHPGISVWLQSALGCCQYMNPGLLRPARLRIGVVAMPVFESVGTWRSSLPGVCRKTRKPGWGCLCRGSGRSAPSSRSAGLRGRCPPASPASCLAARCTTNNPVSSDSSASNEAQSRCWQWLRAESLTVLCAKVKAGCDKLTLHPCGRQCVCCRQAALVRRLLQCERGCGWRRGSPPLVLVAAVAELEAGDGGRLLGERPGRLQVDALERAFLLHHLGRRRRMVPPGQSRSQHQSAHVPSTMVSWLWRQQSTRDHCLQVEGMQ